MTLSGGVLGPVMFLEGIQRVAAHDAAIVQHLEFALSVLAAVLVLGERVGRGGVLGLLLVLAGLVVFSTTAAASERQSSTPWTGLLLLVVASSAWAADNTLSRGAPGSICWPSSRSRGSEADSCFFSAGLEHPGPSLRAGGCRCCWAAALGSVFRSYWSCPPSDASAPRSTPVCSRPGPPSDSSGACFSTVRVPEPSNGWLSCHAPREPTPSRSTVMGTVITTSQSVTRTGTIILTSTTPTRTVSASTMPPHMSRASA